jgi:3-methyl-2-oxobutanoate hydroxymethyltransferase
MAVLADKAGMDVILVGDSAARVFSGLPDFLAVELDQMIYHTQAVARACNHACVMSDLPQRTILGDPKAAVEGAELLISEGHADCVKVEGGSDQVVDLVQEIANAGVPVVGHFGLPSKTTEKGSPDRTDPVVQGITSEPLPHAELVNLAGRFQEAGCCALLLSKIPAPIAAAITESVDIPTIGIGSGTACDGQILILEDLLGLTQREPPYYVKRFIRADRIFSEAIESFIQEVRELRFPDETHTRNT